LQRLEIVFSVSATTRPQRPGEIPGVHFDFIDEDEFVRLIEEGLLLEWASYNGNYYGTPRQPIEEANASGRDVLLEIEIQGARQVRAHRPDALMFFIVPPSVDVLESRLRARGDTSEIDIINRLRIAATEISEAPGLFDHIVVNDDLERAVAEIENLVIGGGSSSLGAPPLEEE
jgi:guanylate kinase